MGNETSDSKSNLSWLTAENEEVWHLSGGGTSLIVETRTKQAPLISYWGPEIPAVESQELAALVASQDIVIPSGTCDQVLRPDVFLQESAGWLGESAIQLTRAGYLIPLKLQTVQIEGATDGRQNPAEIAKHSTETEPKITDPDATPLASWVRYRCQDESAQVEVVCEVQITIQGLVRIRSIVKNEGSSTLGVTRLLPSLPLPAHLSQILDQAGRHLRERGCFTHEATIGIHRRPTHGARNHNASTILGVTSPNASYQAGEVYYGHVEWSGNIDQWIEKTPYGQLILVAGELLAPGEIQLPPGQSYASPWLTATWGTGYDQAAGRFHRYVRSFPSHPNTPRPVTLNAWEAVYFNHDFAGLSQLVLAAAELGVERFVLDDGWFGSRRDDHSGLGDWQVAPEVWPQGLRPLSDLVHQHGMQFGLWFEPEMINPDSDLARAHPDWILGPDDRLPLESRHQQVLNLSAPGALEYLEQAIAQVVIAAQVDYIKWDYNRDLLEPFSRQTGHYTVHAQTVALYRLLDRLHQRFPDLEIESCAGGGGRIDLGIMRRAQRVWGSDCIDPLERQIIQAGTSLLLPPELIGSHIASPTSHTTGRTQVLQLRAINALFYHLGIEWDIRELASEEHQELFSWVQAYRQLRPLFHQGKLIHAEQGDPALNVLGILSKDQDEAYFCLIQKTTSASRPAGKLILPGLDPHSRWRISVPAIGANHLNTSYPHNSGGGSSVVAAPAWWESEVVASGAFLEHAGVAGPILNPERAVLIHAQRLD